MKLVYHEAYVVISSIFKPHQVIFIHYKSSNSRLVVDEDDYGKFRIERVNSGL